MKNEKRKGIKKARDVSPEIGAAAAIDTAASCGAAHNVRDMVPCLFIEGLVGSVMGKEDREATIHLRLDFLSFSDSTGGLHAVSHGLVSTDNVHEISVGKACAGFKNHIP